MSWVWNAVVAPGRDHSSGFFPSRLQLSGQMGKELPRRLSVCLSFCR